MFRTRVSEQISEGINEVVPGDIWDGTTRTIHK